MKYIRIILAILVVLLLAGCYDTISEIKSPEYEGQTVTVKGTAEGVIKIGQLSGYTLVDENGDKIGVSTEDLPADGEQLTVKGVLIKDTIFGYYIKVT